MTAANGKRFLRLWRRKNGPSSPEAILRERLQNERARERKEQSRANRRLVFAIAVTVSFYAIISFKMFLLAMSDPIGNLPSLVADNISDERADIVDRNGTVLATNLPGYSLYADPSEMVDPAAAASKLVEIFPDLNRERLYKAFSDPERRFLWVKQQISPEQRWAVFNLGEPGLQFGSRKLRLFPNGSIGAHILGGVTFGQASVHAAEIEGQAGVEFAYNSYLSNPINRDRPLKLSIDLAVQDALENVLSQGMRLNKAVGAAAVLMEADTGRIVALASLPDFDPNQRPVPVDVGDDPSRDPRFNRAALGTYELGSTFKIFTAALAMEHGYANPNTPIQIGHSIRSGSTTIADFDYYGESLTLHDVIVKSSNIGTARVARNVGSKAQRKLLDELGFLAPTALELPEAKRATPLYPSEKNWSEISTMTISYGHGLSATPLHLATAYATMVNGGKKVTPTILFELPATATSEQIISPETSRALRQMLRDVVVDDKGTASLARTAGYDVGGKTGTADKPRPQGGYYKDKNINTFAAAFPISDPKYVLVTMLDEPQSPTGDPRQRTAGWTAVPVAREIIMRVSPLLNLRPVYKPDLPIQ